MGAKEGHICCFSSGFVFFQSIWISQRYIDAYGTLVPILKRIHLEGLLIKASLWAEKMASLITICPLKLFFFFSCELNQKGKRKKRKKAFVHRIEIVCFLSSWLGLGRGRQIAKSSLSVLLIPSSAEQSREERWMREGADSSVSRVSNPHAEEPGLWISSHH